ncbi:hypothetical protein HPP92_025094 [Vanilla planifolia]|uniref:Fe2OG dioxygenase domain-containing protein n=1 Tax=Vanilla planifolia TaxID=51239 RepID=A0A835PHC6_VANPL|nr:hypothetical protein HPP92_025094 [Vanilla planifolia]
MDCMKEWLEPIIRVQSLSESGASSIPKRYVKPPAERPGQVISPNEGTHGSNVPVIDIRSLVNESNPSDEATLRAISQACRDWGFFQVVNHGVSAEMMATMRDSWNEFFRMPMAEKQRYANSPATFEGYGSRLGVQNGAILDWGDYFFLQLFPESIRCKEKWPTCSTTLCETTEKYGRELRNLCRILTQALSVTLGLEKTMLWRAFGEEEVGSSLRVNYYPKCPQPDLTLGLSAHSDPGGITVLLPDYRVLGLQVRRGDEWITVKPVADSFIVNIGDQIQVLSNAIYKSVEHRVTVNSVEERASIAFFFNPRGDLLIGPAKELVNNDRPPQYKFMTYNEYRLYMRKLGPCGKSHIETMKA